jgi:Tol biopolymer transport system component
MFKFFGLALSTLAALSFSPRPCSAQQFPVLEGDYLGQKAPGMTAVMFAPGIVSTEKGELNSVFTPDGNEFYFTIRNAQGRWTIMVMTRADNRWTAPRPASFSGTYSDVDLFISPDGRRLFFCSNRPAGGSGDPQKTFDIWVVDRVGADWSSPKSLGAPVNSDANEFYPALTKDGTLYFQSQRPEGLGAADIYRAKLRGGAYREAENLGDPINSPGFEGDVLISPDESYLILSANRPGGFGLGDLLISFRGPDGSWSIPVNMGAAVNTKANENCPILSPDGKYLFFTRADDIYWVSAQVIETLRARKDGQ